MSTQDIAEIVHPSGVLTVMELLKLYRYISAQNKDGLDIGNFNPIPRFCGQKGGQKKRKVTSCQTESADFVGDNDRRRKVIHSSLKSFRVHYKSNESDLKHSEPARVSPLLPSSARSNETLNPGKTDYDNLRNS
jgi:hypothetical protein